MCRLAAYLGSEISLAEFLLEPEHSLVKQSWAPKELQEATINADGYGIAWLSNNISCLYKNVLPIWSDANLESLGRSLNSPLWLANVRSATPGQGISEANTQPFTKNDLFFTHNGCFKPFDKDIKSRLLEYLSNDIKTEINGDSDSLYLFALLQQQLLKEENISNAIIKMMQDLKTVCGNDVSALLNFIISDGVSLYACRHAINNTSPSLYYSLNQDCVKIASEPLNNTDDWISFAEHSLISFNTSGIIKTFEL